MRLLENCLSKNSPSAVKTSIVEAIYFYMGTNLKLWLGMNNVIELVALYSIFISITWKCHENQSNIYHVINAPLLLILGDLTISQNHFLVPSFHLHNDVKPYEIISLV